MGDEIYEDEVQEDMDESKEPEMMTADEPVVQEEVEPVKVEDVTIADLVPVIKFLVASMSAEAANNARELFPVLR